MCVQQLFNARILEKLAPELQHMAIAVRSCRGLILQEHVLLAIDRYIYIPVGGASSGILPKLLVFTFVALWHDLSLRLLVWGWLVSFFILPEVIAAKLLPASKAGFLYSTSSAPLKSPISCHAHEHVSLVW